MYKAVDHDCMVYNTLPGTQLEFCFLEECSMGACSGDSIEVACFMDSVAYSL